MRLWTTTLIVTCLASSNGLERGSGDRSLTRHPVVVNPGFESNGARVADPVGWSTSGMGLASYTEAGGHSGSYELTHWSTSAYEVDTYETIGNIRPGNYTLGVWVRSSGGDIANNISLIGCGGRPSVTAVPVLTDGNWLHIVTSAHVTRTQCTINLETDGVGGDWTNYDDVSFTPGYAGIPIRGGDVSSLERSQLDGAKYFSAAGRRQGALAILRAAGMNYVRLRVWVKPGDGFDDEAQLLAMAKQAADHHLAIMLDLHYSDTWADPGHQTVPSAWTGDSYQKLRADVYAYSKSIVGAMVKHGSAPAIVQIGNEINNGMLWPVGSSSDFAQLAGLIRSGIAGVHAADPRARIALHLAASTSASQLEQWYANAAADGVRFDIIALSYYDYWDGRFDVLQGDLDALSERFHKPVLIAETAYPWTLDGNDATTPVINEANATLDPGYPATPAGQAANFRDVLSVVQAVPHGMGLGAFYWEPTWTVVSGNGWDPTNPESEDAWENQAMFDFGDRALPAVADFRRR